MDKLEDKLEKDWQEFIQTGNFFDFTRQWENGFEDSSEKRFQTILKNGLKISLIDTGILIIEPEQASKTHVLISSGIHGNETAPIEIVDAFVKDIIGGQLTVNVNLMLIIGNPPAMNISKRFLSQNLNRLFSERYQSCKEPDYETKRAEIIERAVYQFYENSNDNSNKDNQAIKRFHFDLHTAIRPSEYQKFVLYPFLDGRPWDKEHISFFGGSQITTVLLGNQPAGTFSYFTSNKFNALSATVELGKVRPFGENDMTSFSGIDQNLRKLITAKAVNTVPFSNEVYKVFQVKQELIKKNEQYQLLLDDDVKNFTSFEKGTLLASDGNKENYYVEKTGEAIVFPNNKVPVGQRVGVLLEEIEL